ncbi:MAG: flagellar hook-length control protein FliK [Deltaproteobacteria bacterium]|nr:flagellar hook-length control protein FliK [Deltaproteobacteria bacterium]
MFLKPSSETIFFPIKGTAESEQTAEGTESLLSPESLVFSLQSPDILKTPAPTIPATMLPMKEKVLNEDAPTLSGAVKQDDLFKSLTAPRPIKIEEESEDAEPFIALVIPQPTAPLELAPEEVPALSIPRPSKVLEKELAGKFLPSSPPPELARSLGLAQIDDGMSLGSRKDGVDLENTEGALKNPLERPSFQGNAEPTLKQGRFSFAPATPGRPASPREVGDTLQGYPLPSAAPSMGKRETQMGKGIVGPSTGRDDTLNVVDDPGAETLVPKSDKNIRMKLNQGIAEEFSYSYSPAAQSLGNFLQAQNLDASSPLVGFLKNAQPLDQKGLTKLVTGNGFIRKALAGDITEFIQQSFPLREIIRMFDLEAVLDRPELKSLDLSEEATPLLFLKSLGIDPHLAIAKITQMKQVLSSGDVGDLAKTQEHAKPVDDPRAFQEFAKLGEDPRFVLKREFGGAAGEPPSSSSRDGLRPYAGPNDFRPDIGPELPEPKLSGPKLSGPKLPEPKLPAANVSFLPRGDGSLRQEVFDGQKPEFSRLSLWEGRSERQSAEGQAATHLVPHRSEPSAGQSVAHLLAPRERGAWQSEGSVAPPSIASLEGREGLPHLFASGEEKQSDSHLKTVKRSDSHFVSSRERGGEGTVAPPNLAESLWRHEGPNDIRPIVEQKDAARVSSSSALIEESKILLDKGGGTVVMDLPDMGGEKVALSLKIEGEHAKLRVITDSEHVKEALGHDIAQLKQSLMSHKITLDRFDVDTMPREQLAQFFDRRFDQRNWQNGQAFNEASQADVNPSWSRPEPHPTKFFYRTDANIPEYSRFQVVA